MDRPHCFIIGTARQQLYFSSATASERMEWINAFRSAIKKHVALLTRRNPLCDSIRDILKREGQDALLSSPRGLSAPAFSPRGSVLISPATPTNATTTTVTKSPRETPNDKDTDTKDAKDKENKDKDATSDKDNKENKDKENKGKDTENGTSTTETSPTKPTKAEGETTVSTFHRRQNAEKRSSLMGTLKEVVWFGSLRNKKAVRGEEIKNGMLWREDKHQKFQQYLVVLKGTNMILTRITKKARHQISILF